MNYLKQGKDLSMPIPIDFRDLPQIRYPKYLITVGVKEHPCIDYNRPWCKKLSQMPTQFGRVSPIAKFTLKEPSYPLSWK